MPKPPCSPATRPSGQGRHAGGPGFATPVPALAALLVLFAGCHYGASTADQERDAYEAPRRATKNAGWSLRLRHVGGLAHRHGDLGTPALLHTLTPNDPTLARVVMLPGLGLSSSLYLTTVDGREGWAAAFAMAGHPVEVLDPPNTTTSGLPSGAPISLTTWDPEVAWPRWGLGPILGTAHDDARFPTEHFAAFMASVPGRLSSPPGQTDTDQDPASAPEAIALLHVLDEATAVLLAHGDSGALALATATAHPARVEALVLVEPPSCPVDGPTLRAVAKTPIVVIYGDHLASRQAAEGLETCRRFAADLTAQGGTAEVLDLVEQGIRGNSHLVMQDDNSAQIGAMVLRWLAKHAHRE